MENLNKENFFNHMTKAYPQAMSKFHVWIDAYKNQHSIFQDKTVGEHTYYLVKAPKFHEIPYEMQFGILLKFVTEILDETIEEAIDVNEMKLLMESCFQALQSKIESNKLKT